MIYEVRSITCTAAERDSLREMCEASGIEGAVNLFRTPLYPEDAEFVYDYEGNVISPQPTHYCDWGWLHVDLIALLPESAIVDESEVIEEEKP